MAIDTGHRTGHQPGGLGKRQPIHVHPILVGCSRAPPKSPRPASDARDSRSQARLVGRTCDLAWRRGSWLWGFDAKACIDDLTPLAWREGKDGVEVEFGNLRDFFNHQ